MSAPLWIFYEDSGIPERFGPHRLLLRCVHERLDGPPTMYEVAKRIRARPLNANSNVRKECQRAAVFGAGGPVIALYDDDQIHELTKLPKGACKLQLRESLVEGCPEPHLLCVVLLEHNIESVLQAIVRIEPGIVSEEQKRAAIERKSLNDRDILLFAAAKEDRGDLRKKLFAAIPSFDYLVSKAAMLFPKP